MIYYKIDLDIVEERYEIYPNGKIFDKKRRKYCNKKLDRNGYHRVWIATLGKNIFVHRLILCKFCPNEYEIYLQIKHIDNNKTNNHISNLEWEINYDNIKNCEMSKEFTLSKFLEYKNSINSEYKIMEKRLMEDLKNDIDINIISNKYHLSKRYIRDFKYRKFKIY